MDEQEIYGDPGLNDLLADRLEAERAWTRHHRDVLLDLREDRRELDALLRETFDGCKTMRERMVLVAEQLAGNQPPIALDVEERREIAPPEYRSTDEEIARLAEEMAQRLTPPEINGRPNKLARRIQNGQ